MDGTPAPRVRSPRLRLSGLVRAVITVDQGHVVSATAFFAAHNQQDTAAAATNSSLAIPTAATSQSDVGAELCTVMTATSTTSGGTAGAAVRTPSLLESSSPQRADRCVSWHAWHPHTALLGSARNHRCSVASPTHSTQQFSAIMSQPLVLAFRGLFCLLISASVAMVPLLSFVNSVDVLMHAE
jgi:hypothetical protein